MKYGYVKVRAASPAVRVGDPAANGRTIAEEVARAERAGVEILAFPELSLCGYTCGDLLLQETLIAACERELKALVDGSAGKNVLFFVGLPCALRGGLYDCAAAIRNGRLLALVPKTCLSAQGEYGERRYFAPPPAEVREEAFCGGRVPFGTEILLEDEGAPSLRVACEIGADLRAPVSPSARHAAAGATLIVNLCAEAEFAGGAEERRQLVRAQSDKLCCGYVLAGAGEGESTSDAVYAGHALIAENGDLLAERAPFADGVAESEIDTGRLGHARRARGWAHAGEETHVRVRYRAEQGACVLTRRVDAHPFVPRGEGAEARLEGILAIQSHALARRLAHTGAETAVIGVSGGLDSALAFLVTARAFDLLGKDRKDILAYTMPGFGTTGRTKSNSLALMKEMGATGKTVPVTAAVLRHFKDIGHDAKQRDATYENAQARYRTMILMDVANKRRGIVVGTGDLSELALGWCTYNGDHMSMYAVNGGIPKTLVKALVGYEAGRLGGGAGRVLKSVLETEISPELLPPDGEGNIAQRTEDLVGPYELHDFFLHCMLCAGASPEKTYFLARQAFRDAYDGATVKRWLVCFYSRFFAQQFKRNCSPDGAAALSVSLSPRGAWRMPSDASARLWLQEAEAIETD